MRHALQLHMEATNERLLPMSAQAVSTLAQRYQSHLEDPARRIFVAEDPSGNLVAMVMGTVADRRDLDPSRCGRIDDVWVEPQHRRAGLAKRLLRELLNFFEVEGVATLVLDYSMGNVEAERTWSSLGFEPILLMAVATPEELRRRLETDA
jgi:ribosomal protein S18 acetylase RimI-like enzyme